MPSQIVLIWVVVILLIIIGAMLGIFAIVRDRDTKQILELECKRGVFEARKVFMNTTEHWFYRLLKGYFTDPKYEIFAQVHLAALIGVSNQAVDYYETLEDLDKSIDFVVVDSEIMKTLLAIELNGPDHNKDSRQIRDQYLLRIFKDCGIPFLPIDVSELQNEKKLKDKVLSSLQQVKSSAQ